MKKQSFAIILLAAIVGSIFQSCNDGIFVDPFEVSATQATIGPEKPGLNISISGEWSITAVKFITEGIINKGVDTDGRFNISNPFTEIGVWKEDGQLKVDLAMYLADSAGELHIDVSNSYEERHVEVTVEPTGEVDIVIENVSYNLESWWGYPDSDMDYLIASATTKTGLSKPIEYTFPTPETIPVIYKFEYFGELDSFGDRVLNSGLLVPVPSDMRNMGDFWGMLGDKVPLTTERSHYDTTHIPAMPGAIEIPAGIPLQAQLRCKYEDLAFECTITASSSASGISETIECHYRVLMPMEFYTLIKEL